MAILSIFITIRTGKKLAETLTFDNKKDGQHVIYEFHGPHPDLVGPIC